MGAAPLALLLLSALLAAPPSPERFEGFITFEEAPAAGAGAPQPVGRQRVRMKVAICSRGVRLETWVKSGSRRETGTVLVTGNPPVALEWSDDDKAYVPLERPKSQGPVTARVLGREREGDLEIVRVMLEERGATSEVWTSPGLVGELQAEQLAATAAFISEGAAAELKRVGAWGAVLRVLRGHSVLRVERMERASLGPELFSPASPPAH